MPSNSLVLPGKVSSTSLVLPKTFSEKQWQEVGHELRYCGASVMWWLGDWWAFGEEHEYGSRKEFVESWENGYSYGTCMNAGTVARAVPTSLRNEVLPWSYHCAVAKLEPDQQKCALQWAAKQWPDTNLRDFRQYIKDKILKIIEDEPSDDEPSDDEPSDDEPSDDEPDDDDEEGTDLPEDVNLQKFMGLAHVALTGIDEMPPFEQFNDSDLPDMLRSAQKVVTAWSEVVKSLKRATQGRR